MNKTLKAYQKAGKNSKLRQSYLRAFEPMMIYRTTKTENPRTTKKQVDRVLQKYGRS